MRLTDTIGFQLLARGESTTPKEAMGFPITVTNPKNTIRTGVDMAGNQWSKHMQSHYGYMNDAVGRDGENVDVYVGPYTKATDVHVMHLLDADGADDEDKVMLNYTSADAAKQAFLAQYPASMYGGMTSMGLDKFKSKLAKTQLKWAKKKLNAGS